MLRGVSCVCMCVCCPLLFLCCVALLYTAGCFACGVSSCVCAVHYHSAWCIVDCVCTPLCCVCALPLCAVRSCALCHPRDRSCTAPCDRSRGTPSAGRPPRQPSPRTHVSWLQWGAWPVMLALPFPTPLFGAFAPLSSQGERDISEHDGWVSRMDQFPLAMSLQLSPSGNRLCPPPTATYHHTYTPVGGPLRGLWYLPLSTAEGCVWGSCVVPIGHLSWCLSPQTLHLYLLDFW
jgi:hypothetical protein